MKAGWRSTTIGSILQLEYGKPLDETERADDGAFPAYGANGVKTRSRRFLYDKPSIIVGRKGSAGELTLTEERFWPLDVTYFVTHDERSYDLRFLFYLLTTLDLPKLAKGVKPGINRNEVYSLPVAVPPLPEQRRIVALLDEAFEGIAKARANAEKNIENARAVFAARTDALFAQRDSGWPSRQLGEMVEFRNGINFTKSSRGDRVRIVGVKDFAGNVTVPFDQLAEVVIEGNLAAADKIRPNDILFVRSNGSIDLIGRCLLVEDVPHPTTHSGFTIRARLTSTDVLPEYLCRVLRSNATRQQMISGGIGANIKSLSQGVLAALPIPLPDSDTQARIVAELEELEGTTENFSSLAVRKASALDELKKSLLHHAFAGEL